MQTYRLGFILSCGLHILLLFLLTMSVTSKNKVFVAKKTKVDVVNAVSLNQQKVIEEVNRLKKSREAKLLAEKKRQQQLQKRARAARQKRIAEQRRLAKLKKQAKALELKRKRQKVQEQKKLAELKHKKLQQQREVEQLEKQKQQQKRQLEALKVKQRQQAEMKKQEEIAEQKRLEEKKRAEQKAKLAKQAQVRGEVNKYKALIVNAISQNWILPDNVDKNLSSKFEIKIAPGGAVIAVKLLRSSGDPVLDRSAQTAIYRASPLPVPSDPSAFKLFRVVSLTVKPETIVAY